MNEKDPKVFISHILDCIRKAEEYTEGKTKEDFLDSTQLQDAVIRRIEIIGEASRNIPREIQEKYPHIHWEEVKNPAPRDGACKKTDLTTDLVLLQKKTQHSKRS